MEPSPDRPSTTSTSVGANGAKRVFDIVVGSVLCVLVLPAIVVFAAVLAVQHRSVDVFFTHTRVGHRGRFVRLPKMRTLRRDTHPYADKTVVDLVPVSKFASFLRRSHLDELPQVFLVPIGRLSLVGPRPRMLQEAAGDGDVRFGAVRTAVPQGCTGLWQVGAHTDGRVSDAPAYDYFYVLHRTLRMDVWLLWRTLAQLVGAHPVALDRVPRWTLRRRDADRVVIDLRDGIEPVVRWDGERAMAAQTADL